MVAAIARLLGLAACFTVVAEAVRDETSAAGAPVDVEPAQVNPMAAALLEAMRQWTEREHTGELEPHVTQALGADVVRQRFACRVGGAETHHARSLVAVGDAQVAKVAQEARRSSGELRGPECTDERLGERVKHGHGHATDDPSHPHNAPLSDVQLRVRALESLLTEKGLVDPAALDELIDTYETKVGPRNGALVVAKAWVDPFAQ